jgi:hypothetical protein
MRYHVHRGLREILASRHTIPLPLWNSIVTEWGGRCAYCGSLPTHANRGLVADHLVPVANLGELVRGNTIPACQTCNDARGKLNWRTFILERHPHQAQARISAIDAHLQLHPYQALAIEDALTESELKQYSSLLKSWDALEKRARKLQETVRKRRGK